MMAVFICTIIDAWCHSGQQRAAHLVSTDVYLHKLFPIGHGSCPESTRNLDGEAV